MPDDWLFNQRVADDQLHLVDSGDVLEVLRNRADALESEKASVIEIKSPQEPNRRLQLTRVKE